MIEPKFSALCRVLCLVFFCSTHPLTQLRREIEDEILLRNGRVNIIDLQASLSVDLSHIESKVEQLVSGSKMYHLVHGDIIASYYFDTLAKEINETLQEVP
jgi:hypothetical protein